MADKIKIAVGMSGGVDSSVAAWLLKEQGHQVTGVFMSIWDGAPFPTSRNACYGPGEKEDRAEARRVCKFLRIPFYVYDCAAEYKKTVVEYFKTEYLQGRTPNPCIKCNQAIKLGLLPTVARGAGVEFDKFATGHYAKIIHNPENKRYLIKKGLDPKKDQSYFLFRLSQQQLSGLTFPLGGYLKAEIKKIAKVSGLIAGDKEESQDFYAGDYQDLLGTPEAVGNIVDKHGRVLGKHNGIWNYTLGQRKGLGIAHREPLYVVSLNSKCNEVIVGKKSDLQNQACLVGEPNWVALEKPVGSMRLQVKIRSTHQGAEAEVTPLENGQVKITFIVPQVSITPGQSAVFYDGDLLVGGGTIESIEKEM